MVAYKTSNIKALRQSKDWTQEETAKMLNMSKSGYAQIERGINNVSLDHLKQIADLFEVDIVKLIEEDSRGLIVLIGDNSSHSANHNYCSDPSPLASEIEKLNLIIAHKDELLAKEQQHIAQLEKRLAQQDEQINTLNLLIETLGQGKILTKPS